uniref:Uncharacterized protein n=1 Tax=Anguilla anguilla TaxID=7936 RepID=A0A0E9STV8_ANGAN
MGGVEHPLNYEVQSVGLRFYTSTHGTYEHNTKCLAQPGPP